MSAGPGLPGNRSSGAIEARTGGAPDKGPLSLREDGNRFSFYSNEGDPLEPVHVHVTKGGAEAKFWLGPPAELARSSGFDARTLRDIAKRVNINRKVILEAWHEYFG